jgi:hypothetical protein
MANKQGIRFSAEKIKEIQDAIARGMKKRDVIKAFDITYNSYYRYAPQSPKSLDVMEMDKNKVKGIAEAIKLIVEVAEAVKLIVKDSVNVRAENEVLKKALKYAQDELKQGRERETKRIALTIRNENAVQSLESKD